MAAPVSSKYYVRGGVGGGGWCGLDMLTLCHSVCSIVCPLEMY